MKQANSPVDIIVLDSLETVGVLLDSRQRTAFLPFLGREVSVSEAALEVSELPNTMLYRVKRWLRLGLLKATRVVPHKKGAKQLYRASASAFFVPHKVTSAADLQALAGGIYEPMLTDFLIAYVKVGEQLSDSWGVRFERRGNQWSVRPAKSEQDLCQLGDVDTPASFLEFDELRLNAVQAKDMQLELLAVLEKFKAQSVPQGKVVQVILGLA
jgi:hypothetical protein